MEITQRLFLARRIGTLQTVEGCAVIEQVIPLSVKINHAIDAEKAASGVQQATAPTHINDARQHHRSNPQPKAQGTPASRKTQANQRWYAENHQEQRRVKGQVLDFA